MLVTCFSTAPSVITSSRAMAAFVRPWAISASVSRSRGVSCGERVLARAGCGRAQRGDDLAVQRGAAAGDAVTASRKRAHLADALLEQVADPALARRQQLAGVDRLDVLGEDQHGQVRVAAARLERGADPLVGERRRQAHVDDGQVRLVAGDDPQQPVAVLGLGDDLDVVLLPAARRCPRAAAPSPRRSRLARQHRPDGRADALRRVDVERAVERLDPLAQAARARRRAGSAPPGPLSATSTTSSRRPGVGRRSRTAGARRVLDDVGQRLGDDEVGRGLDHRGPGAGRACSPPLASMPSGWRAPRPPPPGRGRRAPAARSRARGRAARRSRRWPPRAPGGPARRSRAGPRAAPRPARAASSARPAAPGRRRGGRARSGAAPPTGRRARRGGSGSARRPAR